VGCAFAFLLELGSAIAHTFGRMQGANSESRTENLKREIEREGERGRV
jgi:hypothetical protein